MRELLSEVERVLAAGLPCAICTVVATRGSTPQKAGAAMLVHADGAQSGTLGGGCVEAEVKQRALAALTAGRGPTLHTFQLDDDYGWDDGLICGGRMTVLAEPAGMSDYLPRLRQLVDAGRGFTEVVALADNAAGLEVGTRLLFDADGQQVVGPTTAIEVTPLADRPQPSVRDGWAFLPTLPHITLLIVGAGHVGQAVARLAAEVDFTVWILDDRDSYASVERFPHAERRLVGDIGVSLSTLKAEVTPSTYCLIVTRGHNHDEEALYHLAPTPAGYVGMIGSRRKIRMIFDDLLAKGVTATALARVRAPIGLNIGSRTVPEIAVSVVAELIATRNLGPATHRQTKE